MCECICASTYESESGSVSKGDSEGKSVRASESEIGPENARALQRDVPKVDTNCAALNTAGDLPHLLRQLRRFGDKGHVRVANLREQETRG
eukprot:4760159-Pleurochrysis_carterae.AAC.1